MAFLSLLLFLLVTFNWTLAEDDLLEMIGRQQFKSFFKENADDIQYEIVSPMHIDATGLPIKKFKRSTEHLEENIFSINAFGEKFHLFLQKSNNIMADDMVFTARNEDDSITHLSTEGASDCYYSGHVISHGNTPLALSTCNGLTGLFSTKTDDYLIQYLPETIRSKREISENDHIVYRIPKSIKLSANHDRNQEKKNIKHVHVRQAPKNAVNAKSLTIETAMFLDLALFNFYKKIYPQNTEAQILKLFLAIINGVQQLYNDGSLSNKRVYFVIIKFEIFKSNQPFVNRNGYMYLDDFNAWQFRQNIHDDNDARHWDHAYMFAGADFTIGNTPDLANGFGYLNVMCVPETTSTLVNGRSLVAVFTSAHETGHTFGIEHDSENNDCTLPANFMMSGGEHVRPWSRCSKAYFNTYLTFPQSVCLLDERQPTPNFNHEKNNNIWLGQCFDFDQQCELSQGPGFIHAPYQTPNDACNYLQCVDTKGNPGRDYSHSGYQGSPCANGMWCFDRKCVRKPPGVKEAPLGKWTDYVPLSQCQSSCAQGGIGFTTFKRKCVHPTNPELFAKCDGPSIKVDKCDDSKVCPRKKSITDIITETCRRHVRSGATGKGEQATHDTTGGCWVWCFLHNGTSMAAEQFADGVPCGDFNGKYCSSGKCIKI